MISGSASYTLHAFKSLPFYFYLEWLQLKYIHLYKTLKHNINIHKKNMID